MTASDRGERAPGSDDPQQKDEELERVLATVQTLANELHPSRPLSDLDLDSRLDTVVGFDSLSFLELRDRLETEFGMSIPDDVFVDGLTPRDWLRAIAKELAERTGDNELNAESIVVVQEKVLVPPPEAEQFLDVAGEHARLNPERAHRRFESAIQRIYGFYAFGVAILVACACLPVMVIWPVSQRFRWRVVRLAGTILRWLVGIPMTVSGEVPENGTVLVVANHASVVDGLVIILAVRKPLTFLAGAVFARQFLVGRFLSGLGCVFVESVSGADAVALTDRFTAMLQEGRSIASFPEGGLERTPGLGEFHLGAFRSAVDAGVPVVPVGISGTRSIVSPGAKLPRRGVVHVEIGTSMRANATDWKSLIALRDTTFSAVAALSGSLA